MIRGCGIHNSLVALQGGWPHLMKKLEKGEDETSRFVTGGYKGCETSEGVSEP